jgi:DNA-binding NarL/FixJ family response regulator
VQLSAPKLRKVNGRKRVYCVDDNPLVSEALKVQIDRASDFRWIGCAGNADDLLSEMAAIADQDECPDIVLLDIDMPGRDPFEAIVELRQMCPDTKVLMYSGLVRREWIERAMECGAWGYVAKSDGEQALLAAMRAAMADEIAFSPEAQRAFEA